MTPQLNLITLSEQTSACTPSFEHVLRNTSKRSARSRAPKEIKVFCELGLAVRCLVSHFCQAYRRLLEAMSQIGQMEAGQSALC